MILGLIATVKKSAVSFNNGKPLYSKNGAIYTLCKSVMDEIEVKAGLPILTERELGIATIHHIDREMGTANDGTVHYSYTPDIVAVKDDIDNPEVVAALRANYGLNDDVIEFIGNSADTFSIGTPSGKLVEIVDALKSAGIIEQVDEPDVPNLTLGYGV